MRTKLLIAAGALLLGLTPAFAQNAPQPQEQPAAPEAAQPAAPADAAQYPQYPQDAQPAQPPQDSTAPNPPTNQAPYPYPSPYPRVRQRPTFRRSTLEAWPAVNPRADAASYPVYREWQQFSFGAKLLSEKEVEQKFSTPLGKHYLVVEVGVFPGPALPVKLRPQDFTLRAEGSKDQAFFAAAPEDVAGDLAPKPRSGPRVFPSVGVGYGGGPWGSGVSTGVGVSPGRPYGRGPMGNREVMENELRDKSLPATSLSQPAAGYLYFPLSGKRAKHYDLEVKRNGETISLALPTPKN
jgi:hypothetical protein